MYVCSPESQLYPRLHQKQHDQHGEGGDSFPLRCSHETLLGVLHSALGPPAQEGCGHIRMSPEEGRNKDDEGAGAPLL